MVAVMIFTLPPRHHLFAISDELLGEEIAEATSSLHRPDTAITIEVLSPVEEGLRLRAVGRDGQLSQYCFGFVDRHRRMGCLMRIDSNRRDHVQPPC